MKNKRSLGRVLGGVVFSAVLMGDVAAATIVSDGSDGAWSGGGTLALSADGIFNFTTITIPVGATLRFTKNVANTPVVLAATGDVVIDGRIDLSAGHYNGVAGPGGGAGGSASANAAGQAGQGLSPGAGGPATSNQGNAGGGGGMATAGLVATSRTGSNPAAGGGAIGFPGPVGGSGGGGGGGRLFFGVDISGGVGGGGGGGLLITTPGTITVNGQILANGGHGGWAFANVFAHGGPGGGGSGGNIVLEAGAIALGESALLEARGGAGGGLSTETVAFDPYFFSSGANGGLGYVLFASANVDIAPGATITATVVPVPASAVLLGGALLGLWGRRRRPGVRTGCPRH